MLNNIIISHVCIYRPYLLEYLTSAAGDRRRHCQGTAAVCLANLRKTARCGGRKNVPSVEEVCFSVKFFEVIF